MNYEHKYTFFTKLKIRIKESRVFISAPFARISFGFDELVKVIPCSTDDPRADMVGFVWRRNGRIRSNCFYAHVRDAGFQKMLSFLETKAPGAFEQDSSEQDMIHAFIDSAQKRGVFFALFGFLGILLAVGLARFQGWI